MEGCEGCHYNRPMTAWGETFQACFYKMDNHRKELHGVGDDCSGYEVVEKQLEIDFIKER